jgi:hypothetical protein
MSATTLLLQSLDAFRRSMLDAVRDFSAAELAHQPGPRLRSSGQVLGSAAVADREVLRYLGVAVTWRRCMNYELQIQELLTPQSIDER